MGHLGGRPFRLHRIVAGLPTGHRILGTHWWNPPALIPLVEVVQATQTSAATVRWVLELLTSVGKAPAHIVEGLRKQTDETRTIYNKTKSALDALPPE